MAWLGFGGAAVAGVTAVVLFATADDGGDLSSVAPRKLALTCAPTLTNPGGACAFRF